MRISEEDARDLLIDACGKTIAGLDGGTERSAWIARFSKEHTAPYLAALAAYLKAPDHLTTRGDRTRWLLEQAIEGKVTSTP